MSNYLEQQPQEEDPSSSSQFFQDIDHSPTHNAATSTIAMAMLFGTIIFATASLAARLWLAGLWSGGMPRSDVDDSTKNCDNPSLSKISSSSRVASSSSAPSAVFSGAGNRNIDSGTREPKKSQPLDVTSLSSVYSLLHHLTIFGLLLFYSYICENHPPYPHDEKTYDRDEFFFWVILVVVFAGGHSWTSNERIRSRGREREATGNGIGGNVVSGSDARSNENAISSANAGGDPNGREENQSVATNETGFSRLPLAPLPSPCNEVLNRYQTEEWKGWMQTCFLLYHYMHATEVYNGIRVMITCYVWMTGFGKFCRCRG